MKDLHKNHKHCRNMGSSFGIDSPEKILSELNLKEGIKFLDLGCGPGDYSLIISKRISPGGTVYALDINKSILEILRMRAESQEIDNIITSDIDIKKELYIENEFIDSCLISTVLHCFNQNELKTILNKVSKVVKTGGTIVVVECNKKDFKHGPPEHMRISPEKLNEAAWQNGMEKIKFVDLGFNYLMKFRKH